jgi:curved DNA-binding protein CbpA
MRETIQSPYEVLDLPVNAATDVVKRQYKSMIRRFQPEHHPEEFNKIRTAYEQVKSELFAKKSQFPLYKKVLNNQSPKSDTPSVSQHEKLLVVFETPFNTPFELEKILDSIKI